MWRHHNLLCIAAVSFRSAVSLEMTAWGWRRISPQPTTVQVVLQHGSYSDFSASYVYNPAVEEACLRFYSRNCYPAIPISLVAGHCICTACSAQRGLQPRLMCTLKNAREPALSRCARWPIVAPLGTDLANRDSRLNILLGKRDLRWDVAQLKLSCLHCAMLQRGMHCSNQLSRCTS